MFQYTVACWQHFLFNLLHLFIFIYLSPCSSSERKAKFLLFWVTGYWGNCNALGTQRSVAGRGSYIGTELGFSVKLHNKSTFSASLPLNSRQVLVVLKNSCIVEVRAQTSKLVSKPWLANHLGGPNWYFSLFACQ